MKNGEKSVREQVNALLNESVASGAAALPSLRAIRAKLGRGSMNTISEAVTDWKLQRQKPGPDLLLEGFDDAARRVIADAVWERVLPIIQERIASAQAAADKRITIAMAEAGKLRDAAKEMLLEVEAREQAVASFKGHYEQVQVEAAQLRGSLQEARTMIAQCREENAQMRCALNEALQASAAATASLQSTEKLLPFLDPKRISERHDSA